MNLGEDFDFQILQQTKKTSQRSKKIVDELRGLKSKIYSIESDMKRF